MKGLKIADNLTLPLEAVTEKLAWLGRTGSGKTYGATKLAELMLDAGVQIVALDPVGVWRGLRVPSVKGGDAMAIYVFGGLYHDFPLEPSGGRLMADIIADRWISVVLDVSQWVDTEQQRFARDFAEHFFSRKKAVPSAVHLFMEESQEFLPQNPQREEAKTLHHFTRLWKLGRNFGIGGSLISQRPQEVNKKALNMSGTLFAFQMTGPQERKTVEDWISAQGINEDIRDILPTLTVGQPHAWSAAFGFSKTVRILPKVTADVSSSPKVIGGRAKEQPLTPIDVEKLSKEMAATIEKAKAEDPRELRRQIAELKREIDEWKKVPHVTVDKTVEILTDADRNLLRKVAASYDEVVAAIADKADVMLSSIAERAKAEIDANSERWIKQVVASRATFLGLLESASLRKVLAKVEGVTKFRDTAVTPAPRPLHETPPRRSEAVAGGGATTGRSVASTRPAPPAASDDGSITLGGRRILAVVDMLDRRGIPATRETVARWLGLHPNGGRFNRDIAALRAAGLLNGFRLTRMLDGVEPLETGLAAAYAALPDETKRRTLRAVAEAGQPLTREQCAERMGLHPNGGRFNRDLAWLRTMGVIPERGEISVTDGARR